MSEDEYNDEVLGLGHDEPDEVNDLSLEAVELLNDVDKGVVGIDRPKVGHVADEGLTYPTEAEALKDAGDYTRLDNGV